MSSQTPLSLERKLPLLIIVLLLLLTVGLTSAGFQEVRRAAELRGIDRLQRISGQLAEILGAGAEQRLARLRSVAADAAVIEHLANPDASSSSEAAARATLGRLAATPADTPVVAEVRSAGEARRVATRPELPGDDEPTAALIATLASGQAAIGAFYHRGDSVHYWAGAPVTGSGRVLGYVLQRRTVAARANIERQIRGLAGSDSVSIYLASDSGDIWAALSGTPVPVPRLSTEPADGPNVLHFARGADADYVAVYARVPNTPFRVLAVLPLHTLVERADVYLRRSGIVAFVMLLVGSLAAWVLSRHITRPLRDLTTAAEALSTGDYSKRAHVERRDETGRLADVFNTMAEQVQRSHDDLERQIDASRTLAASLEDANRAKADFLATMSHELRTPLNAIGGYVDLLELGVRGPITDEQRHDLERVRYNQRHLLSLIGNILDFARLDAQKLTYDIDDVRVDTAVSEVMTAVAPLLDEKGLRRSCAGCDRAVIARADRGRLEQILLNLLSNCLRFTPAGGQITVVLERQAEQVRVVVNDTGVGIPPEKLEVIFEPFVQVQSGLTRTVGGTGLGLTISRELARAMGGDLTAESDGAAGARFTLTLPSARREAHPPSGRMVAAGKS